MGRGDVDELFLPYGFDEDKSNVLYSSYKQTDIAKHFPRNFV